MIVCKEEAAKAGGQAQLLLKQQNAQIEELKLNEQQLSNELAMLRKASQSGASEVMLQQ